MRRRGKAAIVVVAVAIVLVVVGIPILVTPATDDPGTVNVDVAYVIGPPTDARMEVAYDLIADGRAEALLVSLDPEESDRWTEAARACGLDGRAEGIGAGAERTAEAVGSAGAGAERTAEASGSAGAGDKLTNEAAGSAGAENSGTGPDAPEAPLDLEPGIPVLCSKPDPFTTRGEARWLEDEMVEHGWDSAAVITLTPHISRARMIMERCDTGDIAMVDVGESLAPWYWAYMYAYQTAGFTKAAILQGC
ncbi:hypothetical protein ACNI3K_01030 [Demequina sp. SO4-13]|uniref:hypothetical protein n=1 Tax=Demequina sp. SO4-13 TaxID=3401027 RepID=UPI003AF6BE47